MYSKIFVPVNGSPTSNFGVSEAIKLARFDQQQYDVIVID